MAAYRSVRSGRSNNRAFGHLVQGRRRRLRLEPLEDRRLLAVVPLYVDADSTAADPDGTSWPTAFVDLQDALDQAAVLNADADPVNDITDIWIADGLYTPTKDKHGNATPDDATSNENTYTVLYAFALSEPLVLDGLTITAGRATGAYRDANPEWQSGGGVYADSSHIAVSQSTVSGNSGGGIYNEDTLTLTNSTVSANSARYGGGIFSGGTSTLANSIVAGNEARDKGPDVFRAITGISWRNLIGDGSEMTGLTHGTDGNLVEHPTA